LTTAQALVTGVGLLAMATLIATIWPPVTRHRVLLTLVGGILLSVASAGVANERRAGTAILVSRGYPKPYYFAQDFKPVYFAANTLVYIGAVAVVAAAWPRHRIRASTMPVRMLFLRLTLGVIFLILAVIGGLLPIMQGWIFFLLALLVLFPRTAFAEKVLRKAERKLPRLVAWLRRLGIGTQYQ
jgi:hypothetical protein